MSRPEITLACSLYDRMLPLYLGEVQVEGFDLKFEGSHGADAVRTIFDKMGAGGGCDVSEMSGSEFICGIAAGRDKHVAIPVFPSRSFRSSTIFVRSDRISRPEDLNGKRIGTPLFTMSAAVAARGFLADEYGFDHQTCTWVQGGMFAAGQHGNASPPALARPPRIEAETSGRSLSQLLADGDIDATMGPFVPSDFGRHPHIQRLFPDYRRVEQDYYRRSSVFPIMHVIVLQRHVHERHPQLAKRLFDAFSKSKDIALARMKDTASLEYMLPWLPHDVEEINDVFGGDPWPYGLDNNRPTLEAQTRYLWQQGLTTYQVPVDSIFVPVEE